MYAIEGRPQKSQRSKRWLYGVTALLLIAVYGYWAIHKSLPALSPLQAEKTLQTSLPPDNLAWPGTGQAAASILGADIMETHGEQKPVPIASTAKVITSLVVLESKPLKKGEQGPTVTLGANDVALFRNYVAQDGSLVPVADGERITQYQMLQAIMLPSANNIADSMAIWAFGSLKDYATAANKWLAKNGLASTHVGEDASGLSPTTTSTAADLVKLGKLAMQNPVLAEIAAQPTATSIPLTTVVKNYNSLLGKSNIIGLKTGNTDQAGGVFISASRVTVNDKPVTLVTAVAGAPNLHDALAQSLALVQSAQANFGQANLIKAGSTVGYYNVPWDKKIAVVAQSDLETTAWKGSTVRANLQLGKVKPDSLDAGSITLPDSAVQKQQVVGVRLKNKPPDPSTWWRLSHPFGG